MPEKPTLKRLDQILANYGYASRSEAKAFIREGVVTVSGKIIRDPGLKADPRHVLIDGEAVDHPDGIFVMLNKPAGYTCSHSGSEAPLVYSLLPERWLYRNPAVSTIGRLDKDTTGLIIVTDMTQLVHRLSSPKAKLEKVYEASLDSGLSEELIGTFASGTLMLKDEMEPCLPARLEITGERTCRVTVTEGRYHQVRRMFEAVGLTVTGLKRVRFGQWELGDLPEGEWRDVKLVEG